MPSLLVLFLAYSQLWSPASVLSDIIMRCGSLASKFQRLRPLRPLLCYFLFVGHGNVLNFGCLFRAYTAYATYALVVYSFMLRMTTVFCMRVSDSHLFQTIYLFSLLCRVNTEYVKRRYGSTKFWCKFNILQLNCYISVPLPLFLPLSGEQ